MSSSTACSKCIVSNRFLVMAIGMIIFAACAVAAILMWTIPLDQTLQITVTVLAGVAAVGGLVVAGVPKKCQPCLCPV